MSAAPATPKARRGADDTLATAEKSHAADPERAEMIARVRRFRASWFELAEALTQVRNDGRWKRWGFATFEEYWRRDLRLRKETVDKLVGSYGFLRDRAPEVLTRNGEAEDAPLPSYQAVDFWRRAEEAEAPEETLSEIRRHVIDEGASLPKLSRLYREVVFPVDDEMQLDRDRTRLRQSVERVVELVAVGREAGWIAGELAAAVEEPLARLARSLPAEPVEATPATRTA